MPLRLWTLVLAGGSGRRLSKLTGGIPKQFWPVNGEATLLDETVGRIAALAPPRRRITVVDASHRGYVEIADHRAPLGWVLYQPADRGTAAGVLLGLTELLSQDPDALVMITPADHGVTRADHFLRGISAAADHIRAGAAEIVLFGIEPTWPAGDFGWITPGRHATRAEREHQCLPVGCFTEKPGPIEAARLRASGAVWNTMVLVGRAAAVFDTCRRQVPLTASPFASARPLPPAQRDQVLAASYPMLPPADFSRDVVARTSGLSVYTWPARMGWSDLGTPERVREWRASWRAATRNDDAGEALVGSGPLPTAAAS